MSTSCCCCSCCCCRCWVGVVVAVVQVLLPLVSGDEEPPRDVLLLDADADAEEGVLERLFRCSLRDGEGKRRGNRAMVGKEGRCTILLVLAAVLAITTTESGLENRIDEKCRVWDHNDLDLRQKMAAHPNSKFPNRPTRQKSQSKTKHLMVWYISYIR